MKKKEHNKTKTREKYYELKVPNVQKSLISPVNKQNKAVQSISENVGWKTQRKHEKSIVISWQSFWRGKLIEYLKEIDLHGKDISLMQLCTWSRQQFSIQI